MTEKSLAIAFSCITMLSGCANIGDSISSYVRDLPDDAPKGYALYLDAQDWLAEKDYVMAAFDYCGAAELGYSKANSYCAKYSVVRASVKANTYVDKSLRLPQVKEQELIANMMRREICNAAQYGEPAKSLCKKIELLSDTAVIKTVHNAKNQYLNAVKNQRLKILKEKDKGLSLKLEDF